MSALPPTLLYFRFAGRAFAPRVALFNTFGVDGWKDERIGFLQLKRLRQKFVAKGVSGARLQTANLPQLEIAARDSFGRDSSTSNRVMKFTQSHAIARWAARMAETLPKDSLPPHYTEGLYPLQAAPLEEALMVDEALAILDQILLLSPKDEDPKVRRKRREEYKKSGFLRIGFNVLEQRLQENQNGPFLLGPQLTIADLMLKKPLVDMIHDGQFEHVTAEFLADFPAINSCVKEVGKHPLIKAYEENYKN